MRKRELNKRLKRIEEAIGQGKGKIGFPCDLSPAECKELLEKIQKGKEIDWDRYNFTKCGELPEEAINELYERTKRD